MNQTAYEILNVKFEDENSEISYDNKNYMQSIAYKAINSKTARKFYELTKQVKIDVTKVSALLADNQLTWQKDAPHYFNAWVDTIENKPIKLEYKHISLIDKESFGTNQTLQFTFYVDISLKVDNQIMEKKIKMSNKQSITSSKQITFQIPYIRTNANINAAFPKSDPLTELLPDLQFMQNSLFRAKPTDSEEDIDIKEYKEEISMVLTAQLVEFYDLLVCKFSVFKPETFEIGLDCQFKKCEMIYNNCIVQNYKLDKTPRFLIMNLVNGGIVGQKGESKTKQLIQGFLRKNEKE
ncbi:hypothetical protein SS50377_25524 [Spironucleus salmonicida]|uniref:Uncharacterized protein n=1 Tax=Spironucleus salmonicida TaxID=348837 RepID=V6LKH8_9EUKA|nr:hypothetical protein SS50377_25524 [Spironucleus salmonicida]|eukprot:EST45072.1 Hypothetical protein SS50377_15092 [Spironucleus salmonicida]